MSRVVLAMSGGVDSSVAAHLLREAGHDVVGVFMRHGEAAPESCSSGKAVSGGLPVVTARTDHKQGCCTASDAADARRVADRLDIPFYAVDFQNDFARIIDYFIDEYTAARTPNPCVMCNNWIKFGRLFDYADSVGAEFVATGHYCRLAMGTDGRPALLRGLDETKDQSYVLFGIDRDYLGRMLLPVGGYHKRDIRRMAAELGLAVADKRDSQEICFVPEGDHAAFIHRKRGPGATGEVVTSDGRVVGTHDGLERFTIGQRKGLGIALGEPHFVVRLESDTNRVVLGSREELARDHLTANRTNWLASPPTEPVRAEIKIRYNARFASGTVQALPGERLTVSFDEPQYGVAPGQAVVCYDGPRVLGGGWIE
ncbi:MAG: tRNA 2-thiouridine(34) synthase MnmA [Planctomycetota bacterium]|nr:MAG: tRNA 2-thiouridine(34) synthase MnmA [Planctomycetota bacterium]